MYKKRLLGLAITSALTLTGCLDSNEPQNLENQGANNTPEFNGNQPDGLVAAEGAVYPLFNPAEGALPIPNDLIYQQDSATSRADGTYSVFAPEDGSNPPATALNELSGASTIAPIDIRMSGEILPASAIANASVFLIALDYASDAPLQGLLMGEVPTIVPADQPRIQVSVESYNGENNTIRITPTSPLKPNTRYVVSVSTDVKSALGEDLVRSPGLSGYAYLTNPENQVASSNLNRVVSLIDFWETIIASATQGAVTPDKVAMSYSFTTSNDAKVLDYIADPGQWASDTIQSLVKQGTVKQAIANLAAAGQDVTHAALEGAVNGVINTWEPSTFNAALAPCDAAPAGQARFDCAGNTLIGALEGGLLGLPAGSSLPNGSYFPTPRSRTSSFDANNILDINQISALTAGLNITPGVVSVAQGTIELPYYLETPTSGNGAPLLTGNWKADPQLATIINGIIGSKADDATDAEKNPLAQFNPDLSTAVTANFPFPKANSVETVPVLAIYPTSNSGNMKTVMFQHGITTDRSAALAFGSSLVAAAKAQNVDLAVIAIDQPLHGIDGISANEKSALATQLLAAAGQITDPSNQTPAEQALVRAVVAGQANIGVLQQIQAAPCPALNGLDLSGQTPADIGTALNSVSIGNCGPAAATQLASTQTLERTIANGASTIPGLGQGSDSERHFGFTSPVPGQVTAMDFNGSGSTNASGSMFINLTNFLAARDNLRQGSVDLMTVRKSIGSMDIDDDGNNDLDGNSVYFVGHSLGTVNGIPFVSATSNSSTDTDDITAANMLTPGGGLTRLTENSPAFGPSIIAGLAGQQLTQDTANYQAFLNVLQATVDGADSINFAANNQTPTLYSLVIGDQVIPNAVTDTGSDSNTFNDILNVGALLQQAIADGDQASARILGFVASLPGESSIGPLSGTEPLAKVSSASDITASAALGTAGIVRFSEGFHGTPAFPSTNTNEEKAAFAEMVGQTLSLVASNGTQVAVTNNSVIAPAPAPQAP